jgi:hypothetical protein
VYDKLLKTMTIISNNPVFSYTIGGFIGHAVAQLVEALRYKLEGRGFDSRWSY